MGEILTICSPGELRRKADFGWSQRRCRTCQVRVPGNHAVPINYRMYRRLNCPSKQGSQDVTRCYKVCERFMKGQHFNTSHLGLFVADLDFLGAVQLSIWWNTEGMKSTHSRGSVEFFFACFTAGVPSGQLSKIVTHMLFPDIVRIRQDPQVTSAILVKEVASFLASLVVSTVPGLLGSQLDLNPGIRGWQAIFPMVFPMVFPPKTRGSFRMTWSLGHPAQS